MVGGSRWRRREALGTLLATLLVLAACEPALVEDVNRARSRAGLPTLITSDYLTTQARAHSVAMCEGRAAAPTADPVGAYYGEATSTVVERVGRAALDPGIGDRLVRNQAATDAIWAQWSSDPTIEDPRWDSIGVGEEECDDGLLYMTLVLRRSPVPLWAPADTSQIHLVQSVTQAGWNYARYRNLAAPCSISGYQSFVIGTKVGSSASEVRPLWVKMRGGGAGWFGPDGAPLPNAAVKSEESLNQQLGFDTPGLMSSVKAGPEGFRILIVSMCSHDVYGGSDHHDPFNPNLTPAGQPRPTTGLTATKAAIQFTQALYPTDDYVLHGTSAGGVGTFHVAWALQQQGIPPTAIVSDSGIINQAWQRYVAENGLPGALGCEQATTEDRGEGLLARLAPEVGDPVNEPHLLVSRGDLTVPVMHVYNHADNNQCGDAQMPCPLPDGSTPVMNAADCNNEPMRRAITALGAGTRSVTMGLCVEGGDAATPCDRHVITTLANGLNSDPTQPADYQAAIHEWVRDRLADD